jgi:hypothetical protein
MIWAENNDSSGSNNREYEGATFYFTLPVVYMNGERSGGGGGKTSQRSTTMIRRTRESC